MAHNRHYPSNLTELAETSRNQQKGLPATWRHSNSNLTQLSTNFQDHRFANPSVVANSVTEDAADGLFDDIWNVARAVPFEWLLSPEAKLPPKWYLSATSLFD